MIRIMIMIMIMIIIITSYYYDDDDDDDDDYYYYYKLISILYTISLSWYCSGTKEATSAPFYPSWADPLNLLESTGGGLRCFGDACLLSPWAGR